MQAAVTITGLDTLDRKLRALPKVVAKRVVRKGVRAALKPLHQRARANARAIGRGAKGNSRAARRAASMGPLIAKHIVIKAPRKQRPGTYALHVQMRAGVPEFIHVSESGHRSYIPSAIEFGHGANKDQAAIPHLRPAVAATQRTQLTAFGMTTRNELEKAIRSLR